MLDQDPREKLLHDAVGIRVGVPYSATIKNEVAELSGQVIFAIAGTSAWLTFKFFYSPPAKEICPPITIGSDMGLHIDSLDVCWNVRLSKAPITSEFPTTTVSGWIKDRWFGSEVDGLTSLAVGYSGIPTGWSGNADVPYYEGYNREGLGGSMMAGIQLDYTDWSVTLGRVPDHHVVNGVRHIAKVHSTRPFSSCDAQQFVSDLHYFFCFLFGSNPGMVFAVGRKEYELSWGSLHGNVRQPPKRLATWYGKMRSPHDLSGIFTAFCEMKTEDKNIMSSMITHYTASEEIFANGKIAIHPAIVVSHSALEGLATWIGRSCTDIRDECLFQDRRGVWRIKGGKFPDLVARVCEHLALIDASRYCEIKEQVQSLRYIRNDIAHASNMQDLDVTQLYNTWNRNQCLVEALILRKLCFGGVVPNRTSLPLLEIRGEDVLRKEREEGELWLDAHIPPREEGGECCPHRTSPTRPSGPAITSISSGA